MGGGGQMEREGERQGDRESGRHKYMYILGLGGLC